MEGKAVVGQYTIYGDCVIQQQFIDQPFHCMLWSFLFPSNNMASGNIFSRHRHTAICGAGWIFWLAVSVQSLMWVGWGRKWSDGKMLPMQICHLVIGNWSFEQAGPGRRTQKRKRQEITILRTHSYCMKCLGKKIILNNFLWWIQWWDLWKRLESNWPAPKVSWFHETKHQWWRPLTNWLTGRPSGWIQIGWAISAIGAVASLASQTWPPN